MSDVPYELYYWPALPGRGEFIRLCLEETKTPYRDIGRDQGAQVVVNLMQGKMERKFPIFAPPVLSRGDVTVSQVANVVFYLSTHVKGLLPDVSDAQLDLLKYRCNAVALTIMDMVEEVHHTHHPVSTSLYYEDQKAEAKNAATTFVQTRIAKFFGYFKRIYEASGNGEYLFNHFTYVDLMLFQLLEGLSFAFPKAVAKAKQEFAPLFAIVDRVRARPNVSAYQASPRCMAFNKNGIFRDYAELDIE